MRSQQVQYNEKPPISSRLILDLLSTTQQTSSPCGNETSLLTLCSVSRDGRGLTNMLVGLSLIWVMANDRNIVAGCASESTTISRLLLNVRDDSSFGDRSKRQDIADR